MADRWQTVGRLLWDRWWTVGRLVKIISDQWQTGGGHVGGPVVDRWQTGGGPVADQRRTGGGQVADRWRTVVGPFISTTSSFLMDHVQAN